MRKLDQLNQDIEEALSASSSPSNTPSTTRKKQVCEFDNSFVPHTLIQTQILLCVLLTKQQWGVGQCHGWCYTHSCEAYAAYLVMLTKSAKSISFALWRENPSGLVRPVSNRCSSEFYALLSFFRFRFKQALSNQAAEICGPGLWDILQVVTVWQSRHCALCQAIL